MCKLRPCFGCLHPKATPQLSALAHLDCLPPLQGSAAGRQAALPAAQNTDVAAAHPAESISQLPLSGNQRLAKANAKAPGSDTLVAQTNSPRYAGGLPLSGGRHVTVGERQRKRMLQELAKLGRGCASAASASTAGRYILFGVRCRQTSSAVVVT